MRWRLALLVVLAGCPAPPPAMLPEQPCSSSPLELDFGEVETGSPSPARTVRLRNDSPVDRVLAVSAPDAPFFLERAPNQLMVQLVVPAFGTMAFQLGFQPPDGRLHLGELLFTDEGAREGERRCDVSVGLRGLGTGRVSLEPEELVFELEPGEVETKDVLIVNSRRTPATVSAQVQLHRTFAATQAVTVDTSPLVVPPLSAVRLPVRAAPLTPDLAVGELVVIAQGESTLRSRFTLRAGKPVAEVLPVAIDGWRVQLDPGSQPASFSRRRITVQNVGSSGSVPALALALGQPAFSVEAVHGSLSELIVINSNPLLARLTQGESTELVLHLWPLSVGPKEFRVKLFAQDPFAEPVAPPIEVLVRASVETLPACTMTVVPASSLQLVRADGRLEGSVTFTNTGTTPCIIDDLHLTSTTLPGYRIVSGATEQVEVLPGASYAVTIAGPELSFSRRVGALEHHIFNRNSRTEVVELLAP